MTKPQTAMHEGCPICLSAAEIRQKRPSLRILCERCGDYRLELNALTELPISDELDMLAKRRLAGRVRWHQIGDDKPISKHGIRYLKLSLRQPRRKYQSIALLRFLEQSEDDIIEITNEGLICVMRAERLSQVAKTLERYQEKDFISVNTDGDILRIKLLNNGRKALENFREDERNSRSNRFDRSDDTGKPSVVRLEEVFVNNLKSFAGNQIVPINGRKWTVVLGENGVGKSTLLQAIAALYPKLDDKLYAPIYDRSIMGDVLEKRYNEDSFRVECLFSIDDGKKYFITTGAFDGGIGSIFDEQSLAYDNMLVQSGMARSYLFTGSPDVYAKPSKIIAYGASRMVRSTQLSKTDVYAENIQSIFDPHRPLLNPEEWLLQADYSARLAPSTASKRQRLARIKDALLSVLPDVRDIEISVNDDGKPTVLFQTSSGTVGFRELGLGYQSTIGWLVDLAATLFQEYEQFLENPLEGNALVLIDEIELHLHPVWQRELLEQADKIFPNAQFVVTTHSPLVVQAIPDANIVLLERHGDAVRVTQEEQNVASWRVDQILSSELFGVDSLRSKEISELYDQQRRLLSKRKLTSKDEARLTDLNARLDGLNFFNDRKTDEAIRFLADLGRPDVSK